MQPLRRADAEKPSLPQSFAQLAADALDALAQGLRLLLRRGDLLPAGPLGALAQDGQVVGVGGLLDPLELLLPGDDLTGGRFAGGQAGEAGVLPRHGPPFVALAGMKTPGHPVALVEADGAQVAFEVA